MALCNVPHLHCPSLPRSAGKTAGPGRQHQDHKVSHIGALGSHRAASSRDRSTPSPLSPRHASHVISQTDWSQQVRPMRKNASQVQIVGTHRVSLVSARHRSTTRHLSNNTVLRMHNYIHSKKIQKKETRWYQLPRGHQMHLSKS